MADSTTASGGGSSSSSSAAAAGRQPAAGSSSSSSSSTASAAPAPGGAAAAQGADDAPFNPQTHVRLVSADGDAFVVERRAAMTSGFLRGMLSSSAWVEASRGEVSFPSISTPALAKCVEYMRYKLAHSAAAADARAPVPPFPIPVEDALELLATANYLDL